MTSYHLSKMLLSVACLLLSSSLGSGEPISPYRRPHPYSQPVTHYRRHHPFSQPAKPSLWTEIGGAFEDVVDFFLPEIPRQDDDLTIREQLINNPLAIALAVFGVQATVGAIESLKATNNANTNTCKCGVKKQGTTDTTTDTRRRRKKRPRDKKNQGDKIVGGSETEVNEYPWIASMIVNDEHYCGGSLIASQWVVTAAHCFYDSEGNLFITDPSNVTVALGEHDSAVTNETNIRIVKDVTQIILHSGYNISTNVNDIALLKLSSTVDLNTYTPVCLPEEDDDEEEDEYAGKNAWVYGWGALSEGGPSPTKLQELEVAVATDAQCKTAMDLTDDELAVMLCAGGVEGKDSCQGDSGGPLSYDMNGQHQLIGVVSWGIGCAQDGLYGVYAEVTALRTWIDENIADNGGATYC